MLEVNQAVFFEIRYHTSLVSLKFQVRLTKGGLKVLLLGVKYHLVEVSLILVTMCFDYRNARVLDLSNLNWLDKINNLSSCHELKVYSLPMHEVELVS